MLCGPDAAVTILIPDLIYRNSRWPALKPCGCADGSDYVWLARLPAGTPHHSTVTSQDQDGRRPQHVQLTDQVKSRFSVDLDVSDTVSHPGDVGQDATGCPARRAERRRKLHQSGPRAQGMPELVAGERNALVQQDALIQRSNWRIRRRLLPPGALEHLRAERHRCAYSGTAPRTAHPAVGLAPGGPADNGDHEGAGQHGKSGCHSRYQRAKSPPHSRL